MKEKGFTLVELLAVIVVVGLLASLIFAGIQGALERNKTRQYEITKELIIASAKTYMRDHRSSISDLDIIGGTYFLPIGMLQDGVYLEQGDLLDPRYGKNIPDVSFVVVYRESKYNYTYELINGNEDGIRIIPRYFPKTLNIGDSLPTFTAVAFEHAIEIKDSVKITHHIPNTNGKLTEEGTYTVTMQVKDTTVTKEVTVSKEKEIVTKEPLPAEPVIKGDLIPVTILNDGTVKRADTTSEWYNYSNKEWANAIILIDKTQTYNVGDIIPESNIESYFVWIPRYKYKIFDEGTYTDVTELEEGKEQEIEIVFEDKQTSPSIGSKVGEWLTHPAFTNFDVNGIWIGKFELGYKDATTTEGAQVNSNDVTKVVVKPNVYSWRSNIVKNFFEVIYNYNRNLDSHMMKNTEWGAVAYLSHSKYGKNGEIVKNNYNGFKTGCGSATVVEGQNYSDICDGYNSANGLQASTTGNITGIYDMSGGAHEYVAGYRANTYGSSGFDTDSIAIYNSKYFDVYNEASDLKTYQYRILGDATAEMGPFAGNIGSWYGDNAYFVNSSSPWFFRGGYSYGVYAGLFAFDKHSGDVYHGLSARVILAP